ncbi:hypothetical protein HanIR_Chr10g0499901 [Helianthus annuus]|nr:hypothetical protein HanIR_Chr10g0499901 [Helianthus annuus]
MTQAIPVTFYDRIPAVRPAIPATFYGLISAVTRSCRCCCWWRFLSFCFVVA